MHNIEYATHQRNGSDYGSAASQARWAPVRIEIWAIKNLDYLVGTKCTPLSYYAFQFIQFNFENASTAPKTWKEGERKAVSLLTNPWKGFLLKIQNRRNSKNLRSMCMRTFTFFRTKFMKYASLSCYAIICLKMISCLLYIKIVET